MNCVKRSAWELFSLICLISLLVALPAQAAAPLNIEFGSVHTYSTGQRPDDVAIADLTNNGVEDLIVTNYADSTVSVLLGNGAGTFMAKQDFATCTSPVLVKVADLNQDGKPDLVVLCPSYGNVLSSSISVLLGNGDGTFQAHVDYSLQIGTVLTNGSTVVQILVGDLNHDGYPDVVAVAGRQNLSASNGVEVFMNAGAGHNGALLSPTLADSSTALTSSDSISDALLADFNGDNNLDIAYAEDDGVFGPFGVGWALGNGVGTFGGDQFDSFCPTCSLSPDISGVTNTLVTGDMNGDGNLDLVYASGMGPCVMLGDGKGGFTSCAPQTQFQFPPQWPLSGNFLFFTQIGPGDFNKSGVPSLVALYHFSTGGICTYVTASILIGKGDGTFQPGPTLLNSVGAGCPPGSTFSDIAVGDLNGDGLPDVVVIHGNDSVDVLLNTSSIPDQVPIASNANIQTLINTAFTGNLSATQSQGNPLSYSIVNNPSHGTVTIPSASSSAFTYTPAAGYVGSDTFTFKVNDGYQNSNVAIVSVTVGTIPTAAKASGGKGGLDLLSLAGLLMVGIARRGKHTN